jgi:hypothetical protein
LHDSLAVLLAPFLEYFHEIINFSHQAISY